VRLGSPRRDPPGLLRSRRGLKGWPVAARTASNRTEPHAALGPAGACTRRCANGRRLAFGRPLRLPAGPLDLLDVDRRRRSLNGPGRGLRGGAAADRDRVACWKCPNEGQVKASVEGRNTRPPPVRLGVRLGVRPRVGPCARRALGGWHARHIGRNPRPATRPHAIVFGGWRRHCCPGDFRANPRRLRATARALDLEGSAPHGWAVARAASSPGL